MAISSKELWNALTGKQLENELRFREMQARVQEVHAQQQYANIGQGLISGVIPPNPAEPSWRDINTLHTEDPRRLKIQQVIYATLDKLPWNIVVQILRVCGMFLENEARIVVKFKEGREISFIYTDDFPADEHLARIALECP